jgi:hypothetical protein
MSTTTVNDSVQVVTGEQPFPGAKDGTIIYRVVTGDRPSRPSGVNEWVSDDVWDFICRCWSPSLDGRPDVDFAMNALNGAADDVEARRRQSYATNRQGKGTSRGGFGESHWYRPRAQVQPSPSVSRYPPSREFSNRPLSEKSSDLASSALKIPTIPYPFVLALTTLLKNTTKGLQNLARLLRPSPETCRFCALRGRGRSAILI